MWFEPAPSTSLKQASRLLTLGVCSLTLLLQLGCREVEADRDLPQSGSVDSAKSLGMVSSAHELATRAGVLVLERGGNAFDASLAVAAALTVVEPTSSNLFGGYGTLIVFDSESKSLRYLDNNGRFPQTVDSDVFRPPADLSEMTRSAKAISTPGNLNGFEALWREHGSLKWDSLFESAIRYADEGFEIEDALARSIDRTFARFSPYTQQIYGRELDGDLRPLASGELLVQSDLAESFRLAAKEGADALYGGALGVAIDAEMKRQGGFLSLEDLERHEAEWFDPISIDYRGYQVVTAGPPSNSFASLLALGLMSRFDNRSLGHNTSSYLHHFAESAKHAYWARLRYAGGPEVNPPPLDRLLSPSYWQEQSGFDPGHASDFEPPVVSTQEGADTTHFVVADHHGNVVSATLTLGQGFGSAVMAEGTGIWLNNSLAYSTFEPPGNPMDALPGRRKHSSKSPTMILREGRVWVAIGTPGGHTIPQTVPQMVINLIDFEMSLQEALDAPRIAFAHSRAGSSLMVEESLDREVRDQLAEMGHPVEDTRGIGLAHALAIEYGAEGEPTAFQGAADSRGIGAALEARSIEEEP